MRIKQPLKYHGGQYYTADWLISLFPARGSYVNYVEPYCGGCAVLFAHDPEGVSEVINDIDDRVNNFWWVLRDGTRFPEFCRQAQASPFSEAAFAEALHYQGTDLVKKAWAFFVTCRMSLAGRGEQFTPVTKTRTRRGMNNEVSAWLTAVEGLRDVHERLKRVLVVGPRNGLSVINEYDTKISHLYCFHPDTMLRTADERMVAIKDVRVGENLAFGKTVMAKGSRRHTGPIISVKAQGLPDPVVLTPEHRVPRVPKYAGRGVDTRTAATMWSQRELVTAGELAPGDRLLIPVGHTTAADPPWPALDGAKKKGLRKDVTIDAGDALYKLLGYFAAEGHIQRDGGGEEAAAILSFCSDERDTLVPDAAACCERALGVTPLIRPGPVPSVIQVNIHSKTAAKFISQVVQGKQPERRLCHGLLAAPTDKQRLLLQCWLRGDGGLENVSRNRTKLTGTSSSETLARQMFLIAMRCGLKPAFKRRQRNFDVYFSSGDAAALGFPSPAKKFRSQRRLVEGHILSIITRVDVSDYDGDVFDVTVDGDHLVAAPFALAHNCDPPFMPETRSATRVYRHEMTLQEHTALLERLARFRGTFTLSGYRSPLYEKYARDNGWHLHEKQLAMASSQASIKARQVSCAWTNYEVTA